MSGVDNKGGKGFDPRKKLSQLVKGLNADEKAEKAEMLAKKAEEEARRLGQKAEMKKTQAHDYLQESREGKLVQAAEVAKKKANEAVDRLVQNATEIRDSKSKIVALEAEHAARIKQLQQELDVEKGKLQYVIATNTKQEGAFRESSAFAQAQYEMRQKDLTTFRETGKLPTSFGKDQDQDQAQVQDEDQDVPKKQSGVSFSAQHPAQRKSPFTVPQSSGMRMPPPLPPPPLPTSRPVLDPIIIDGLGTVIKKGGKEMLVWVGGNANDPDDLYDIVSRGKTKEGIEEVTLRQGSGDPTRYVLKKEGWEVEEVAAPRPTKPKLGGS